MATAQYTYLIKDDCGGTSTSSAHYHSETIQNINKSAVSNIPANSNINSVIVYATIVTSVNLTKATSKLVFSNAKNDSGETLASESVGGSKVTLTTDITNRIQNREINTDYTYLLLYSTGTYRKYTCSNFKIVYTYTPYYTVLWKNYDGTILETDEGVNDGVVPSYNSSIPVRPSTAEYDYTFSGWSPTITAVTADTTYTAQFTAIKKSYDINVITTSGGTVIGTGTYEYGSEVTLKANPDTGYKFTKWIDNEGNEYTEQYLTVVVEDTKTYTAYFEHIKYEVHTYIGQECIDKQTCIYDESYYTTPNLVDYASNGNRIIDIFRCYYIKHKKGSYSTIQSNNTLAYNFSDEDGTIIKSQIQWQPTIVYDSIFSFNDWRIQMEEDRGQNPIVILNNATIETLLARYHSPSGTSYYYPSGYMLISNEGSTEGTLTSHRFKVTAGQSYNINFTVFDRWEEPNWDVYIFFEDENGEWIDFDDSTNRISYNEHHNILYPTKENLKIDFPNDIRSKPFVVPEGAVQAQIRIDANGSNHEVQFSNFRIYPSDKKYMSCSITDYWRNDTLVNKFGIFVPDRGLPIPENYGYTFKNWQDENEKNYTSDSTFPEENLILYSQWEKEGFGIHNGDSTQRVIKAFIGEHPVEKIFIGEKEI